MCENCVCGCLRRRSDQLRLRGVEKNERICQSGLYVKTSRMASKKCAPNYITKKQNGPSHYREWEIPIPLVNMKQLHTQTGKTWVIEIDLWSAMTRIDNVKNQSTREILQSFFFSMNRTFKLQKLCSKFCMCFDLEAAKMLPPNDIGFRRKQ